MPVASTSKEGSLAETLSDRVAAAAAADDTAAVIAAFEEAAKRGLTGPQWEQFARALLDQGDSARALTLSRSIMDHSPPTPGILGLAAAAALREKEPSLVLRFAAAAERLEPGNPVHARTVFEALIRLGAATEAIAALRRQATAERFQNLGSVTDLCRLAGLTGHADWIPQFIERLGVPDQIAAGQPLLFVSMPKSASATISGTIAARLGCEMIGLGADLPDWCGFPDPWLNEDLLGLFAKRRIMLLSHAAALPCNERALKLFPRPIVVHLRDPRDALVSLFEMAETFHPVQALRFLFMRPDYAALSRRQRLDALRAQVYPQYVRWIAGWLQRSREDPGAVRFSCFENFIKDQEGTLSDLARSFGAADSASDDIYVMHFRKGLVGGHRAMFDAAASREMFEAIPVEACQRFGWEA